MHPDLQHDLHVLSLGLTVGMVIGVATWRWGPGWVKHALFAIFAVSMVLLAGCSVCLPSSAGQLRCSGSLVEVCTATAPAKDGTSQGKEGRWIEVRDCEDIGPQKFICEEMLPDMSKAPVAACVPRGDL